MADTPATSADIHAIHNDLYALGGRIVDATTAQTAAITAALTAQTAALVAAIQAGGTVAASPGGGTGGSSATPATDFFPANPGDAPFPSPENSNIIRVGTDIEGKPYLRDLNGSIHTLGAPGALNSGWFINGGEVQIYNKVPFDQLVVRAGKVYGHSPDNHWFDARSGSSYTITLPAASTDSGGGTPAIVPPVIIAPVAPSAIQPGTSGRTLTAAPGQVAAVLATTQDGDTLVLDGQYAENIPTISVALHVTLAAGTVVDFTNATLAQGKGGFVPMKDFWLEALGPCTVKGAGIKETSAGGTGAVRPGAACRIRITGPVTFTGNQNGLSSGGLVGQVWDVSDAIFDGNGLGDGRTHNIYISDGAASLTLTNVTSKNCDVGHALKSRCSQTKATGCQFLDPPAGMFKDNSSTIDLPDGGTLTLTNCTVTKSAGALNKTVFGLGMENGALVGTPTLVVTGGTIDAECDSPVISGQAGAVATLAGVTMKGNKVTGQGATLTIS